MELRHYFGILRRRLLLVLVTVVVALAVAGLATPKTHKYTANAVIYVGATKFSLSPGTSYSYDPTQLVDRLIPTYAALLDSEPIAADAIAATQVQRTPKKVVKESQVTPGKGTQLLMVSVTDKDPAVAQKLANGIADAFEHNVGALNSRPGQGSLPSVPAYVFQRADLPDKALSTGLLRNLALAGFFGLLISVGLVLLLDYLDLTLKTAGEAERRLQLPVLGFISFVPGHEDRRVSSKALKRPTADSRAERRPSA